MNDYAQGRVDRECHAIHKTVRDMDGMNGKRPDFKALSGANLMQLDIIEQLVLFQLVLDIGQCEFRSPHGDVQFRENPGQRADVILMSVGKDYTFYRRTILNQIRDVRYDNVDPEQLCLGEHQPGVNDDDVVPPAHGHAVHAELAESAEWYDLELSRGHQKLLMLAQKRVSEILAVAAELLQSSCPDTLDRSSDFIHEDIYLRGDLVRS